MDGKTSEEKEENPCKTFDVKSRIFKMYHMQVSEAKAFYSCNDNSIKALLIPEGGGGALGYFLGGYVPPGTPNWHPVLEKISPKIDTPF